MFRRILLRHFYELNQDYIFIKLSKPLLVAAKMIISFRVFFGLRIFFSVDLVALNNLISGN